MFNDFKIRTYSTTQNKLRVLKDIFDRLNLFNFEKRLNILIGKVESLKKIKDEIIKNPPIPTEFVFGEFLIIHAHNPDGKDNGQFGNPVEPRYCSNPNDPTPVPRSFLTPPQFYIDNQYICTTPLNLVEHNFPIIKLSNYGIRPGSHTFKVIFNGIIETLNATILKNSIHTLTFEFQRIEQPIDWNKTRFATANQDWQRSETGMIYNDSGYSPDPPYFDGNFVASTALITSNTYGWSVGDSLLSEQSSLLEFTSLGLHLKQQIHALYTNLGNVNVIIQSQPFVSDGLGGWMRSFFPNPWEAPDTYLPLTTSIPIIYESEFENWLVQSHIEGEKYCNVFLSTENYFIDFENHILIATGVGDLIQPISPNKEWRFIRATDYSEGIEININDWFYQTFEYSNSLEKITTSVFFVSSIPKDLIGDAF